MRHGLGLGVQLLPCGNLLEDLPKDVPRTTLIWAELLSHAELLAGLLDEVLKVLVVTFVRQVGEAHLGRDGGGQRACA